MPREIDQPLKPVIERISTADRRNVLRGKQILVAVHPKSGKVLVNKQPWLWDADSYQFYVVTPDVGVGVPQRAAELSDLGGRRRTVEYALAINEVDTARVAELARALSYKPLPKDALTELVTGWLQEYIDQNTVNRVSPLADFSPAVRERAGTHVATRALAQLGLRLTCAVDIPEDDIILHLDIPMQVFAHDCEETLDARLELDLEKPLRGAETDLIREHAQPKEEMEERLRTLAGRWFRAGCSLEDFCYREERVRAGVFNSLKDYLDNELKRRVSRVRVVCTPKFRIDFPREMSRSVKCEVRPGSTTIKVDHKLMIKRVNIAELQRARIENLEHYIEQTLEAHTRNVFFGKQYVDVIVEFSDLSAKIEADVKPDMARVGFEVTQLITLPDDPFVKRYIEGEFSFDTGSPPPAPPGSHEARDNPQIFPTKDPRVTFGLSVTGRAKLRSYDRVRELNLITPGHDLAADFKRVAREAAAEVIRTLSPQQLYIQFHEPVPTSQVSHNSEEKEWQSAAPNGESESISPELQIHEAVEKRLGDEFDAKVEWLNIRQEVTELSAIVDALQPAADRRFELDVQTAGAEDLTHFTIAYRIQAIDSDGWLSLQKLCGGAKEGVAARAGEIADAVMLRLKDVGRQRLRIFDRRILSLPLQAALEHAQTTIFNEALKGIQTDYGLVLKISVFDHDGMIPAENPEIVYLKERLRLMRERALELPHDDSEVQVIEEEMKNIQTRIDSLKPNLDPYLAEARESVKLLGRGKGNELPSTSTDPARLQDTN